MTDAVHTEQPQRESPGLFVDAAHLFALCGFAIAQPLLDLLGNNPTFFVAHDIESRDVVLFALALLVIPPAALFGLLALLRLVSTATARIARAVIAGTLISLTLVPPIQRGIGLSTTAWIVLTILLAIGVAWAYDRFRYLRTFVTYLAAAPVLFLVVFLVLTPVSTLVFGADPKAAAVDLKGTRTPIVVVAFDEFPLGVLLDEDGELDAARFPGFARLASISTWYPNATTVSVQTLEAIPAIETGLFPVDQTVPVAAAYPRSIFTLFARSHELHVTEAVTRLCPRDLCHNQTKTGTDASFTSDLRTVYLRTLLPNRTATDWGVPTITDRWAGFDEEAATKAVATKTKRTTADFEARVFGAAVTQDQSARFATFLASLGKGDGPGLWFHHALLPHVPYRFLPDGRVYNWRYVPEATFVNPDNVQLLQVDSQRLLLQAQYTDSLVDALIDELEAQDLLDTAIVAVIADHGESFVPNANRRAPSSVDSRNGVLPVPLFVKYPGQQQGAVDPRDAQTIDLVPTIADALGVDLPRGWDFDGRSLASEGRARRRPPTVNGETFSEPVEARQFAATFRDAVGTGADGHDGYRVGPFGSLVGEPLASLPNAAPTGRIRADSWALYDAIDLNGILPVLFEGTVTGVEPGQWVAVTLNGTVAGLGPTYQFDGATRVVAMLDPSLMVADANTVRVFLIGSDGSTLHPIESER